MDEPQGDYRIERMPFSGVETVIDWAAAEGWNPGLCDAACFYAIDPNGFFMGGLDGRPIARVAMPVYDESFAFCGLYIVDSAYRGRGFGLSLTKASLDYIGDRNAGLDGVEAMAEKYARLGYRRAHRSSATASYRSSNKLRCARSSRSHKCPSPRSRLTTAHISSRPGIGSSSAGSASRMRWAWH
jgi:GNAT superfamily N-acetyltransferase